MKIRIYNTCRENIGNMGIYYVQGSNKHKLRDLAAAHLLVAKNGDITGMYLNMNGDQNIQNLQHWQNGNGFSHGTKCLDIGGYTTKTMLGVSENLPPESLKKNQIMGPRRDTTIYCNLMRNITINPNMAF